MDLYDIAKYGGATVGGLGMGAGYQTVRDMYDINKMASMGNYSSLNPMPQEFMNKLRGAWTPSSTFQKTGYPTGLKNWFFSRSSPQHFGPVEKIMNWGRAGLPYLKQGAKFLGKTVPQAAFASDALFGTSLLSGGNTEARAGRYFERSEPSSAVNQYAAGRGAQPTFERPSANRDFTQTDYGKAYRRGGIASLWQR